MNVTRLASAVCVLLTSALAAGEAGLGSVDTTFGPAGYTVRWQASDDATVTVRVSSDPAAAPSSMRIVGQGHANGNVTVPADVVGANRRPYFLVDTGARSLRTATRLVPLEGAPNFRDVGGYATADGKHVVWGRVFRSNELAELTARDYATVDKLGVKLVCDLRTDEERQRQPTSWQGNAPAVVDSPKATLSASVKSVLDDPNATADEARAAMIAFYRDLPTRYADEYRGFFARLVAGQTPLIVHCSAGKDRTGLAVALFLAALGVPRAAIDEDYALSAQLRREADLRHVAPLTKTLRIQAPAEAMAPIEAGDPAYLSAAFDAIVARWGSIDAYLEQQLGVGPKERATLRERYLEERVVEASTPPSRKRRPWLLPVAIVGGLGAVGLVLIIGLEAGLKPGDPRPTMGKVSAP